MSIFASMVTSTCQVTDPDDPTVVMSALIQRLTPKQLRAAAKASQETALESMRAIGPDLMKAMRDTATDGKPDEARDPLLQYDRSLLLKPGLLSIDGHKVLDVDDISDDPADTIARAILKLSKPSLFQTKDEVEADRKNGSSGGTKH